MFMCRHLLTFARAWRFVLQWLVSHTPVCAFAIFLRKKKQKEEVNFPRHEHPKKGLAMSSGQCHLFCDSQFVSQRPRLVFESACDSLSQQASHFLE